MTGDILSQDDIDHLIHLDEFINSKKGATRQLIREMRSVILDSGKLSLEQWRVLREGMTQIEELLPVMDMIIRLKADSERDK